MSKSFKKVVVILICVAMVLSLFVPMVAQAGSVKELKKITYTAPVKTIKKKATKVKKGVTNIIAKEGWVCFKAPKKGTYTFEVSDIGSRVIVYSNSFSGDYQDLNWGFMSFLEVKGTRNNFTKLRKVRTEYGKTPTLNLATKDWCNKELKDNNENPNMLYRNLIRRSATIKLKKKETIYCYFWFLEPNTSCNLTIY